jgi:hypothetical protein
MIKIVLPFNIKILNICHNSQTIRSGIMVCISIFFCAVGLIGLNDFLEGNALNLSKFFPLFFLNAGICLFLGIVKPRN